MTTTKALRAERIDGTNKWVGIATYQGARIECPHRHLTAPSARQCADLPRLVKAHRDAKTTTAQEAPMPNEFTQALIQQGVDFSAAQDKAFMADDHDAEAFARGGLDATQKALAKYLGINQAQAVEMVLTALPQD